MSLPRLQTTNCGVTGINDNTIQLTSNGFSAHINLSLGGVANDFNSFREDGILIARGSKCCDAHAVAGTG